MQSHYFNMKHVVFTLLKLNPRNRCARYYLADPYTGGREFIDIVFHARNGLLGGEVLEFIKLESKTKTVVSSKKPTVYNTSKCLEDNGWKLMKVEDSIMGDILDVMHAVKCMESRT